MIITRTPFRFTLGGGGTDLPAYYSKYGGILMFYTGTSRNADTILSEQSQGAKEEKKDVVESMHTIKELGYIK